MMGSSKKIVSPRGVWHFFDILLTIPQGVIHSIHFHRLILDEAHSIKVCERIISALHVKDSAHVRTSNVPQVLPVLALL